MKANKKANIVSVEVRSLQNDLRDERGDVAAIQIVSTMAKLKIANFPDDVKSVKINGVWFSSVLGNEYAKTCEAEWDDYIQIMSKRYRARRRDRYNRTRPYCQHEGCREKGHPCYLPMSDQPDELLCWHHSRQAGYCPSCGLFWAGVDSFDFSQSEVCENCRHEFINDSGEYDDDEEMWDSAYT